MSYSDYRGVGGCEIPKAHNNNTVLVSGAEDPELVESFKSSGWEVKPARGCGHKLLKVALGTDKHVLTLCMLMYVPLGIGIGLIL